MGVLGVMDLGYQEQKVPGELGRWVQGSLGRVPCPSSSPWPFTPRTPPQALGPPLQGKVWGTGPGVGGAAAPPGGSEWGTCRRLAHCSQRFVIISRAFLISKKPLASFISSCEAGAWLGHLLRAALRVAPPLSPLPSQLEGRCHCPGQGG